MGWRFRGYCEDFGIDPRRARQFGGLFGALLLIYAVSIASYLKFITSAQTVNGLGDLMRPLLKFCLLSALPFAVLAYRDQNWRSSDAAPVCVVAWIAVCAVFGPKYGTSCPMAFTLPFVPFILSALLAHTLAHVAGKLTLATRSE
ncbi:MAG: hypothetical protein WBD45_24180 [Terriglobales bacterium]